MAYMTCHVMSAPDGLELSGLEKSGDHGKSAGSLSMAAYVRPLLSRLTSCWSHSIARSTERKALSILSLVFQSHSISRVRFSTVLWVFARSLSSVRHEPWRASVVSLLACNSHIVSFISVACVSMACTIAVFLLRVFPFCC